MLPQLISDAKGKHPTFLFSVIRSRMLPQFISDAKGNHPTFIFSVIRSRMLPQFISDAKDKHPTFIFSVIRSRMLAPFISDAKDKHRHLFLASYGADHVHHGFFFFFFFFFGGGGGAWVRRIYIRENLFRFTACSKFGSLPCIFGVSQHVTERFHLPLFVTDKWVKCYCELILGLASLPMGHRNI